MTKRPVISVCAIVKDEAARLPEMIRSVRSVADEIILVDTASTDNTVAIGRGLGARVFVHPWSDSFAEARNHSIEHARGEWILVLDADDHLLPEGVKVIRKALEWPLTVRLPTTNQPLTGYLLGVQQVDGSVTVSSERLFRRSSNLRYYGRVHEDLLYRGDRSLTRWGQLPGVHVAHSGYDPAAMPAKYERNLRLLLMRYQDDPSDVWTHYFLAVTHRNAGEPAAALAWASLALSTAGLQPQHRREMEQIIRRAA